MGKNAIVGQSGGPTSVITASLAGVIESCKNRGADVVDGMCNGVAGLLEERVVDLSTLLTDDLDIELLKRTPSSYLGSCRYKLPDWHTPEGEAVYIQLFVFLFRVSPGGEHANVRYAVCVITDMEHAQEQIDACMLEMTSKTALSPFRSELQDALSDAQRPSYAFP